MNYHLRSERLGKIRRWLRPGSEFRVLPIDAPCYWSTKAFIAHCDYHVYFSIDDNVIPPEWIQDSIGELVADLHGDVNTIAWQLHVDFDFLVAYSNGVDGVVINERTLDSPLARFPITYLRASLVQEFDARGVDYDTKDYGMSLGPLPNDPYIHPTPLPPGADTPAPGPASG